MVENHFIAIARSCGPRPFVSHDDFHHFFSGGGRNCFLCFLPEFNRISGTRRDAKTTSEASGEVDNGDCSLVIELHRAGLAFLRTGAAGGAEIRINLCIKIRRPNADGIWESFVQSQYTATTSAAGADEIGFLGV